MCNLQTATDYIKQGRNLQPPLAAQIFVCYKIAPNYETKGKKTTESKGTVTDVWP